MHFCRVPYFADITPKSKSPKLRSPTIIRRRGPLPPAPSVFPVPPVRRRERVSQKKIYSCLLIQLGHLVYEQITNKIYF
jgi:hypothetical protein